MYKDCCTSKYNIFFSNIGPRFESFKTKMLKFSEKNKISFDEDIFMDTVIKCSQTFKTENATNDDVDKYFWVAYKQNYFSKVKRNKIGEIIDLDELEDDIIDDEYNSDIDDIISIIKEEIQRKFGERIYTLWFEHLETKGKTTDNDIKTLEKNVRKIKRYISGRYTKKNKNLKSLLKEHGYI
jgi:hypothetical protein